ncbi:MAG: polysaccharide deacetylase family protein, partial [Fimbriimonadales bacterium]|nr:polysaccharide deacetylase family protein [Fimbriimonadales bacterium]
MSLKYLNARGLLLIVCCLMGVVLCSCGQRGATSSATGTAQSLPTPEIYKSPSELQSQHDAEIEQNITLRKLMRGDPKRRWIALTFDDGPHPDYTPRIVEILKRYKVHATFFVVGKMAEKHPELIQLLHESGEEIGNHTYDHVNLTKLDSEAIAEELKKCGAVIQR